MPRACSSISDGVLFFPPEVLDVNRPVCAKTTLQQVLLTCEVVNGMDNSVVHPLLLPSSPPLLSYRTRGYRRWTSSETRGSVVCGLNTKRRTYRCPNLRYTLFHLREEVLSKVADTPPSLIFGMWSESMIVGRRINLNRMHAKSRLDLHVHNYYYPDTAVLIRPRMVQH